MSPEKRKLSSSTNGRPSKAIKHEKIPSEDFEASIVHRVVCSAEKRHFDHPRQADYLTAPRLFHGDSKASNLRGEQAVENAEQDLQKDGNDLIWMKIYSCTAYHDMIDDQFTELEAPLHPMSPKISRHFSFLPNTANAAEPVSQVIVLANNLLDPLEDITKVRTERIFPTDRSPEIEAVVDRLYIYSRHNTSTSNVVDTELMNLLHVMEIAFRDEYREADDLISNGFVTRSHLAKPFRVNEIIVTHRGGHPRAYLLKDWPIWRDNSLILPCETWSFDGRFFRETEDVLVGWDTSEEKKVSINRLSAYPLRFDRKMKSRLLERGNTFWQCRKGRFVSYSPASPAMESESKPRYMLDAKTYHHVHTRDVDTPSRQYLSKDEHEQESPPGKELQLLLPPTIPGFGFHDKKWIPVPVEDIQEIQWNGDAFNHLVLTSTKKELIKALVRRHTATSDSNDVIQGKGNGLILLLHGGPGTGKTLTAESVAELTKRPLYRVTCGEIGTNAKEVERYLESVLYLARVWQCVVLLDEADVFLEERTQQDWKRNAIVSVFLRVLECNSGIICLTTNRVGTFDEAVKSRVQLTLHYPTLDEGNRRRIWSNFITRLHQRNPNANADQILDNLDSLAKFNLNGREIRNSIRTAMLLAEFRNQALQYSHLAEVIDVSNEFERYLMDTHGYSASENAKSLRIRAD